MTEPLRTDLTTGTDRALHPEQHNEVNRRVIALEDSRGEPGGLSTLDMTGLVPAEQLPAPAAAAVSATFAVIYKYGVDF